MNVKNNWHGLHNTVAIAICQEVYRLVYCRRNVAGKLCTCTTVIFLHEFGEGKFCVQVEVF